MRPPLLVLAFVAGSSACASSRMELSDAKSFQVIHPPPPPGMSELPGSPPFTLLPLDQLEIQVVIDGPPNQYTAAVDPTGHVGLPLVGAVPVAGLTLEEAQKILGERFRNYARFALTTVSLRQALGHRITVAGAISKTGRYTIEPGMRVADLLAEAGGFVGQSSNAEWEGQADLDAARLVRAGVALPISIRQAQLGHPRHNIHVASGDYLWIPPLQGAAIRVLGEVGQPKRLSYRPGLRLTDVLSDSGGLTDGADGAQVRIIRGPLSSPRVLMLSFDDVLSGAATDIEMERGDIVSVGKHWFRSATDVLQRLTPAIAAAALGVTLAQ